MQPDDLILSEDCGDGVCALILNRPDKLNAFTHAMITQWGDKLDAALADPAVKVIVLRANGRAFCAGGDADEMAARGTMDSMTRKNYLWEHIHRIPLAMERHDKPVIAAVQGLARGAGCDMALMCDIRIAGASASFGESYINMGLIAGDGGTWFLPRLVGTARALELLWTGRAVDAAEADRIGLVNRVVPDEDLVTATLDLARSIAGRSQPAVRAYRRAVYGGMTMPLTTHLDMLSSHMAVLRDTDEHRASLADFRQRQAARRDQT